MVANQVTTLNRSGRANHMSLIKMLLAEAARAPRSSAPTNPLLRNGDATTFIFGLFACLKYS